jgi:uncharacterized glyoxalase superfamily protein PhnB
MQLAPAIPVLRIFDEAQARAFYVDYLGFSWDGEHRFAPDMPLYAFLSRGPLRVHLSEHHGDATPGSAAMVPVSDAEALLTDLRSRGHPRMNPDIEELPWGRQIAVTDPFGNQLLFLESDAGQDTYFKETS